MSLRVGGILAFDEVASSPSSPPAGQRLAYPKTDGFSYWKNSAGTEYQVVTNNQTQTMTNKSFGDTPQATSGIYLRTANGKVSTDAPSTYPIGTSTTAVVISDGWPVNGLLVTHNYASGTYCVQTLVSQSANPQTYTRSSADNTTWSAWLNLMDLSTAQTVVGATKTFDVSSKIRLLNNGDAGLATDTHAFQIGPTSSPTIPNLIIDNNEIMGRLNGGNNPIFINTNGGGISLGDATSTIGIAGLIATGCMAVGQDTVTITTVNTNTSLAITGLGLIAGTYSASVSANSSAPLTACVAFNGISNTGVTLWAARNSGTTSIGVSWIVLNQGM